MKISENLTFNINQMFAEIGNEHSSNDGVTRHADIAAYVRRNWPTGQKEMDLFNKIIREDLLTSKQRCFALGTNPYNPSRTPLMQAYALYLLKHTEK